MAEPTSPAGWLAVLAAILLPTLVAAGGWWGAESREAEVRDLRARLVAQDAEIERLERQVAMLEEDLDSAIDLD